MGIEITAAVVTDLDGFVEMADSDSMTRLRPAVARETPVRLAALRVVTPASVNAW